MITTMSLLEMSLYGGIFIAAITVLRAVAFSRLPKSAMKILWGAAFFRLMIPVTVTSPVSIYSAAGKIIHTARRSGVLPSGYTPAFLGNHAPVFSGNAGQLQGGESLGGSLLVSTWASPAASWISPWILIWAAVAIAAAVCFWISHRKGMKIYRESLPLSDPLIENWMEGHRLRRKVSVRVCDRIDSPLTYGVFCPVILLPKSLDRTDEVRLSFILAHEMAHIRRFDALMKWLLAAMVCIHWFNPMGWVMYVLANRDMELSCDEYVVRLYGYQTRATYALTLVGLEEHRRFASPLSNSFCKNAMKERITAIMKSKKTTAVGMGAALLVIAGAVSLFIPNARIEQGQVSAAEEENQEAFKGTEGSIRTDVSQGTEGSPKTEVIQGGEGFPKTEVIQGGEGSPKTEVSPGVENSHQMNAKNGTDNSPETDIIQTAEASPKNGNSQDKGIENPRKTDISGGEVSHNENDDEMDGKQGTAAEGKASWADRYMEGTYTQQEYDMIISALKFEGYEDMSIAEFNRKVNKVLTDDDQEYSDLMITYEFISSMLSDEDENKAFLCNTVGASIEEYQSRLEEVYTGKEVDPSFNVTAQVSSKEDVFGDEVELIHSLADYSFTYRILDQDNLTVGERDYFLETIMAKMQEYLESGKSFPSREEGDKAILEALKEIGNAASTEHIMFTGGEIYEYVTEKEGWL